MRKISKLQLLGLFIVLHMIAASWARASANTPIPDCDKIGVKIIGEHVMSRLDKKSKKLVEYNKQEKLELLSANTSPAKLIIEATKPEPVQVEAQLLSLKGQRLKTLKFESKTSKVEIVSPEALGLVRVAETSMLVLSVTQKRQIICRKEIVVHANN